jgi:hypothetical protein
MKRPALAITAFLFVLVPFLTWRSTWFGRRLSDREMQQYLYETEKPRRIQHALSQISDRIVKGDPRVREWYPRVAELARHADPKIRINAAWVMGQDGAWEAFHQALRAMLQDPDAMVRGNAALALVRFGDAGGRPVLTEMLRPREGRPPGADQVWEALRGLYLVGQPEDLPDIERYRLAQVGLPDRLRRQAVLTAQAIRTRAERNPTR